MTKEPYLLVSLDDAKNVAQAISNATSRRILEYLAEREASASEIAKELGVALSTIHYNLEQLKKSKLVEVDSFHYSKKGKEVQHYKLANKYIVIAPKETKFDALKNALPVALIVAGGVAVWQFVTRITGEVFTQPVSEPVQEAALFARSAMAEDTAMQAVAVTAPATPVWPWFLYGALTAILLYVLLESIKKWRRT